MSEVFNMNEPVEHNRETSSSATEAGPAGAEEVVIRPKIRWSAVIQFVFEIIVVILFIGLLYFAVRVRGGDHIAPLVIAICGLAFSLLAVFGTLRHRNTEAELDVGYQEIDDPSVGSAVVEIALLSVCCLVAGVLLPWQWVMPVVGAGYAFIAGEGGKARWWRAGGVFLFLFLIIFLLFDMAVDVRWPDGIFGG